MQHNSSLTCNLFILYDQAYKMILFDWSKNKDIQAEIVGHNLRMYYRVD